MKDRWHKIVPGYAKCEKCGKRPATHRKGCCISSDTEYWMVLCGACCGCETTKSKVVNDSRAAEPQGGNDNACD